jgi:hypothetical protein
MPLAASALLGGAATIIKLMACAAAMRKNIALAGQALSLAIIYFLLDKYPIYIHSHPE